MQYLGELGLTEGEAKTYLALLKIGHSSTGKIAKESQVSRSKLYGILDKLEKKGIVSHYESNGVTHFVASEPTKLKQLIVQKEQQLKKIEKKFEDVLPLLQSYYQKHKEEQSVALYQGFKGLITAHEHLYEKLKKGDKYYYLGIPADQPQTHHLYWQRDHKRRIKEGITCKLLFNQDAPKEILENRNSYKGCEAKYLNSNIKTPAYFLIYADVITIAIASITPIAIEITSKEIAKSFKEYFEEFWKLSVDFN